MTFETNRLLLRPWREEDAEALYFYARDPEVGPPAGWQPHESVEESLTIIRTVFSSPETYAICFKGKGCVAGLADTLPAGSVIGCVGFHRNDLAEKEDEYELGYWLGKPFWGQGIVPEAAEELLRHAFEDLLMKRIWCGYYEGNFKSRRVIEKLGFVYHHTTKGLAVNSPDDIRTGHAFLLTKEKWIQNGR